MQTRPSTFSWLRMGLRLLAEGGWLSVVYAAFAVVAEKRAPMIGPFELTLLIGLGALVSARARKTPRLGIVLLIGVALLAGLAGLLMADMAYSGVFGAVAVGRGAMIGRDRDAAAPLERLLVVAFPLVAVVWAATLVASDSALVVAFSAAALWGTVFLIAAGTVGMGLTRLDRIHSSVEDRPTRRAWQVLVAIVGLAIVPLAVPFGLASGIPAGSLAAPFIPVAQLAIAVLAVPFDLVAVLVFGVLRFIFGAPGSAPAFMGPPVPFFGRIFSSQGITQQVTPFGVLLVAVEIVLIVGFVALVYLLWLIFTRGLSRGLTAPRPDATPDVQSAIVHPATVRPAQQPRARWRRPGRPRDAVSAYLAALAELRPFDTLARQPAETPADHVTRLRAAGAPFVPDLGRLAADYQIVRYAERPVSRRENQRALSRLKRLRRLLRRDKSSRR